MRIGTKCPWKIQRLQVSQISQHCSSQASSAPESPFFISAFIEGRKANIQGFFYGETKFFREVFLSSFLLSYSVDCSPTEGKLEGIISIV